MIRYLRTGTICPRPDDRRLCCCFACANSMSNRKGCKANADYREKHRYDDTVLHVVWIPLCFVSFQRPNRTKCLEQIQLSHSTSCRTNLRCRKQGIVMPWSLDHRHCWHSTMTGFVLLRCSINQKSAHFGFPRIGTAQIDQFWRDCVW